MNPLLSGTPNIPNIGQLKSLFQMIQYSKNPKAMIDKMISQSPQGQQMADYVNAFGGDYEKAFKSKAQEMGIDPNEFINNFK